MRRRSLLLGGYRLAARAFEPFASRFLERRLAHGKEDAARLGERLGIASRARPPGTLLWLHGASVGEAASLLPLVSALREIGCRVLMTTGTVTSARMLERRMPPGVVHQFVPVDGARFVRRFLAHWRPDMLLIAESELWPNMIWETHRAAVPMVLVNARMSARSAAKWTRARGFIRTLLGCIDLFLAQTVADADRFSALGAAHVRVAGNLKYDVPPPAVDHAELGTLTALIGARPVWIAASTHEGEERLAAEAHATLVQGFPQLLTIVAPRHPDRASDIAATFRTHGLSYASRARGQPPSSAVQIYLIDTIGDLGTIYRLASVVFLGKSLVGRGGQNPIEPVKCGCFVLHGPHVQNFEEAYRLLDAANGAQAVSDLEGLCRAVGERLADPSGTRVMARAAAQVVERQTGTVLRILQALAPFLPTALSGADARVHETGRTSP